jgi:hypothetical protein
MTRRELELKVELLEQKIKTLELELELELIKNKPDKEHAPYWPHYYPYPIWIDDSRMEKYPWISPYQPYAADTVTTGTDPDKFKDYVTY